MSWPGSGARKPDLLAQVSKTLKLVLRHRRERHVKLKELSKADVEGEDAQGGGNGERLCPVCRTAVSGDTDVVEAHVDACLAHAVTTATANGGDLEADGLEEYEAGGETRLRIAGTVDFRGVSSGYPRSPCRYIIYCLQALASTFATRCTTMWMMR